MSDAAPDPTSFLSGDAGDVSHPWRRAKRSVGELAYTALDVAAGTRRAAARLARSTPPREVLVIGVYRPGSLLASQLEPLHSERHTVRLALGALGSADPALRDHTVAEGLAGGKFENLNAILAAASRAPAAPDAARPDIDPAGPDIDPAGPDVDPAGPGAAWVLVVDDDVRFPRAFVDRLVAVCEAFSLDLAQPAQTLLSHSAWKVTRRRPASLVRETRFVEIGPVTAFGRRAAAELLPFPRLRYGWGLDLHWAALAGQRGWRLGIVDALPVRHETATVGSGYSREEAIAEAAAFLAGKPSLPSVRAGEVLSVHRRPRG